MSNADARARHQEVRAAFLEGWRKAHFWGDNMMSDRSAWEASDAYGRLAYGVLRCFKCRSEVANVASMERCEGCGHGHPVCAACRNPHQAITAQEVSRSPEPDEPSRLDRILHRSLMEPGDRYDAFPDRRDGFVPAIERKP